MFSVWSIPERNLHLFGLQTFSQLNKKKSYLMFFIYYIFFSVLFVLSYYKCLNLNLFILGIVYISFGIQSDRTSDL